MAHPEAPASEAVDVQPDHSDSAALDAFDSILEGEQPEEDAPEDAPEAEDIEEDLTEEESDEEEAEEEDADEEEEQETAIPAPVSFNADEKAVFATMTPEQQQAVAAIETRRNTDVQKATTEAAEAKRTARQQAEGELIQIQRGYAAELAQYAKAYEVADPDYSLLATNPQAFAEQLAYQKQATAQQQQMMQQAKQAEDQANALEKQRAEQWESEQQAILSREIPEWNDPVKRQELVSALVTVGKDLGFDDEALSNVDATELLALRQIANDRKDAVKYRELTAKNMERVRSFKGKPAPKTAQAGTAQPRGSGDRKALAEAKQRLKQTGSDADALAIFDKIL